MTQQITPIQAINQALIEEMKRDEKIFIIGEEVGIHGGAYGATQDLMEKYGEHRVIDAPISEIGFTGIAAGAAQAGLHPIVDFMTWNFALQAIDHIINTSAKSLYMSGGSLKSPIVFRGPNGFNFGVGAQHTQDFSSFYGSVPGLKVIIPYTAKDYRGCLKTAIRDKNPVVFLENEVLYKKKFFKCASFENEDYTQEFKAVNEKEGSDLTLIGIGITVGFCLEAAEILEKKNISVEVLNLISIRPIDYQTIFESAEKTKRVIIVDNSWPCFSVASELSVNITEHFFDKLKSCVKRINAKDVPTPYSKNLETLSLPDVANIIDEAVRMVKK